MESETMHIQPTQNLTPDPRVRISKRALRQVMRVNPQIAAGRSVGEFKDYLEQGGTLQFGQASRAKPSAFTSEPAENKARARADLEHAVGFFVKSQTHEAEQTLAQLDAERQRIEVAMDAAKAQAEDKIRSFLSMLDPVALAQFGPSALAAHAESLEAVGITPSNLFNI